MTTEKTRPELGKLVPGQNVMVRRAHNYSRGLKPEERYVRARVTKVARVWVELKRVDDGWPESWRMRRDTQNEGFQNTGSNASFATLEQYQWDEDQRMALDVLRANKITVEFGSPWKGREIELAEMLTEIIDRKEAQ